MLEANLQEYRYVSRYASDPIGLEVYVAGVLADPDSNAVNAEMLDAEEASIFSRAATRDGVGLYTITLASGETATPGYYRIVWTFDLSAVEQTVETFIQIGEASPAYDALVAEAKDIVESVWARFADLYDSPLGGPNLQVYFQSKFGRGRVAQAMQWALNRINSQSQPKLKRDLANYDYTNWRDVLEQGTYVEVLKHLSRSYLEQPEAQAVGVARMDRRDYSARWRELKQEEEQTFKQMLDVYKISQMGLGGGRVLLSGGVFGNYGPSRLVGSAAARPRYWSRFY